jgi:hypothetical protein
MEKTNTAGRRNFLKIAATGTAAIAINPGMGKVLASSAAPAARDPGNKWPGRIAINFNKTAVKSDAIDETAVAKMVD